MLRKMTVALAAALFALAAVTTAPNAPAAHADAAGHGGDFVPLPSTPVVLDTRNGTGGVSVAQIGAAATVSFPVLGVGGVPTTGVGAVLVRVVLLSPTVGTWVELWPDGTTRPTLTMVSAAAGEQISNTAVVKVGSDGKLSLYNSAGKTNVAVEVQGYFKAEQGTTGGGFFPVTHTKVIDTRTGLGTANSTIASGATRTVTITGSLVPAGSAAALVDITVPTASAAGWLDVSPAGGTARPVMNYETGNTQTAAILTLPANGQVTFTNKGSAAVELAVTVEGYYSSSSTQGAGYRQVASRLLDTRSVGAGLPLAANATIDVQVGGTNGLPTRGIEGAVLNLLVVSPQKAGWLKAWPVGATEPSVTMLDFKAGDWRDNALVLKPGTDGKIRVRNGSADTVHLIVDLEGWYADPLPVAPVAQNTRMTAMQAAPAAGATAGTLEYSYVDNAGRVVYGHQTDVDNFGSVQWMVISGNEAYTGQPTLTQRSDGRIQVAAQHNDSDIWTDTQTTAGGPAWSAWADFGGSMASPPVTAKLSGGTIVEFAADVDGKLWAYAQTGAVPYWRDLGDQDLTATLTVVPVSDGLRVFGLNGAGALKTIEYYNDGSVSAWTDLGGSGLSGQPSVVVRPGYYLQVFARAADGTIATKLQNTDGSWPADYTSIGNFVSAGAPSAIMDPALGRLAVVVRGTDNEIYHVWETATGANTWGDWTKTIAATDPSATDPTTTPYVNSNGQSWLITFRNANGAVRFYDRQLPAS